MEVIQKQLVEAKKNERANALNKLKHLWKGLKVGRSNKLRVFVIARFESRRYFTFALLLQLNHVVEQNQHSFINCV